MHIRGLNGNLNVFNLEHNDDGLWVNGNNANPDSKFNPDEKLVLVSRNSLCFPLQ